MVVQKGNERRSISLSLYSEEENFLFHYKGKLLSSYFPSGPFKAPIHPPPPIGLGYVSNN